MPAGVAGKINIAEAMQTCRTYLQVPQRAVPLLRSTPGVGKSDGIEQIAIEFYERYAMGKGCPGCEATGGPSHDPQAHKRGCGAHHDPTMCNICHKDRIVIEDKVNDKGEVVARVPTFKPYPAHVMLVDIRLGTFDPIETKGLPYVAEGDLKATVNGKDVVLTRWACPEWLPTDHEVYCILFLDEFLNAPAAVQNASLQLIYDKKIHTHKLGRLTSIALAGNTEGDGSYITRLGGAAKNRLAHLEVQADPDTWVTWAQQQNDIPEEFIGAVRFKGETFIPAEFSKDRDAQSTPRSFTTLARLVSQTGVRTDKELRRLANPLIGHEETVELIAYIGQYQKVKPQEILLEGKMPAFEREQASLRYAAACSVANFVHKNPGLIKDKKHVDNFFNFLKLIGGELATKCLEDMHLIQHTSLVGLLLRYCGPEFKVMMADLAEALTSAENESSGTVQRRRAR